MGIEIAWDEPGFPLCLFGKAWEQYISQATVLMFKTRCNHQASRDAVGTYYTTMQVIIQEVHV